MTKKPTPHSPHHRTFQGDYPMDATAFSIRKPKDSPTTAMPNQLSAPVATDHRSVGRIAGELGVTTTQVINAAAQLSIRPALILDTIPYYTPTDVVKLSAQVAADRSLAQVPTAAPACDIKTEFRRKAALGPGLSKFAATIKLAK